MMRGYFGMGVEGLSKPMNAGNLIRSAHAFGAQFFFVIDADPRIREMHSDTSRTPRNIPFYLWESVEEMVLPDGCDLVGVELTDHAVDLPSFRHPKQAAYMLGPERGSLSEAALAHCRHVVRIPTAFCINVATAGALVMYDRMLSHGRFAARPISARKMPEKLGPHRHGGRFSRRAMRDAETR